MRRYGMLLLVGLVLLSACLTAVWAGLGRAPEHSAIFRHVRLTTLKLLHQEAVFKGVPGYESYGGFAISPPQAPGGAWSMGATVEFETERSESDYRDLLDSLKQSSEEKIRAGGGEHFEGPGGVVEEGAGFSIYYRMEGLEGVIQMMLVPTQARQAAFIVYCYEYE